MKEIKSREDANKYYKKVNEIIDGFINKTNARPLEVYRYISRHMKQFLENNDLQDVVGINRIVMDVLDHRKSLQMDKIITFENFNQIFEDISDLRTNDVNKEKILADFFHVSTGHINVINQDLNFYNVKDYDKSFIVTILSNQDFKILSNGLKKLLSKRIYNEDLNFNNFSNQFLNEIPNLKLGDLIDESKLDTFLEINIDSESCLKYYQYYLSTSGIIDLDVEEFEFIGDSNGYKIWKIHSR